MSILQPQFGRYKEFVTGDTGLFQRIPDLGFILVRRGGIDQAVSRVDGINHGSFCIQRHQTSETPPTSMGHFNTVVQFYSLR